MAIPIITLLLLENLCFSQGKKINGDTSFWYRWQKKTFQRVGVADLTIAKEALHFRFSSEIQAVDIWTTDFKSFEGIIANYTTSYQEDYKDRAKKKVYSEKIKIDTANARKVFDQFTAKSIFRIPRQDSIVGWNDGMDGITYFIEYSTPSFCSFKDYWTPSEFRKKIDEATRLCELNDELETLLGLRKTFDRFIQKLPYGTYRVSGIMITTTGKAKKKKWK